MNQQQLERMHSDLGFIAALDQSGGSTPKALLAYGLDQTAMQMTRRCSTVYIKCAHVLSKHHPSTKTVS